MASVETRIENLESQLAKLQDEVRLMREGKKDWRRTIGAFTNDDEMKTLLQEAMLLRETERDGYQSDAHGMEDTNGS